MHLQEICSGGGAAVRNCGQVQVVMFDSVHSRQTFGKSKKQKETWLFVPVLSNNLTEALPEQTKICLSNHFLHHALLNKQNLKYVEKERLLPSLQESSHIVAAVKQDLQLTKALLEV